MEPFANIVECIQPMTIFAKHSILAVSQGRYASGKTKEKLGAFLFISQKIKTAISADFFHFKLNFIFTLLPYVKTLLIANSIHVSLISS